MLVLCLLRKNQFNADIALKLGSSFSLIPFVIVVVSFLLIQLIFPYLLLNAKYEGFFSLAGSLHSISNAGNVTTCSAFLLPHSSH